MDTDTFIQIIRVHQADIYRFLRFLGASRENAEDLTQDTFLAAFNAETQVENMSDPQAGAYLRGIARYKLLNHRRKEQRHPVSYNSEALQQSEDHWQNQFLREGDGYDYVLALRKCLAKLPGKQRQAIDLRYRDKASRSDMAQQLDMAENSVKSLLQRVRTALAHCVEQRLKAEGLS